MPGIDHAPMHLAAEQIDARLDWVEATPAETGTVEGICIRPEPNQREELSSCLLSPELGVEGDFWVRKCGRKLEDGSSDPAVQLAIMNSRAVDIVAGSRDRWKWAGDQLFVDFDLGEENLAPGDRLHIGPAVVEISDVPHTGCDLFKARYGMAAVKFINSRIGKSMRLRGVLAQIVQEETVSVGDTVRKADRR